MKDTGKEENNTATSKTEEVKKVPAEDTKAIDSNSGAAKKKTSIEDFEKVQFLGKGSYARVVLMKHKNTNKLHAMKIVRKQHMYKEKKEEEVKAERDVLVCTDHPGIIRLFYSFRDKENLYFALEYAPNGTLADLLKAYNKLPLPLIKQYVAEIVNVLQYLHSKGIAHRDLKPENIMLSEDYHVKLADFGTAKFMTNKVVSGKVVKHKGYNFVGTAQFVSPEVLTDKESGPACDLWALGCIIYLLFVDNTPFTKKTEYLTFEAIMKGEYKCPKEVPPEAESLCKQLLIVEADKRLGSGLPGSPLSYEMLKQHKFFEGINFEEVMKVKIKIEEKVIEKMKEERKEIIESDDDADSFEEEHKKKTEKKANTARLHTTEIESKILKEGVISIKTGLIFYNEKKVVLTSKPKLLYYEPGSNVLKGEILLARNVKAVVVSGKRFNVEGKSVYKFEGNTPKEAEEWTKEINNAISEYSPD